MAEIWRQEYAAQTVQRMLRGKRGRRDALYLSSALSTQGGAKAGPKGRGAPPSAKRRPDSSWREGANLSPTQANGGGQGAAQQPVKKRWPWETDAAAEPPAVSTGGRTTGGRTTGGLT